MVGFRHHYMVENIVQACFSLFVFLCFMDLFARSIIQRRLPRGLPLLCSFAAVTCFEMLCTSAELKMVDLVVLLIAFVLLAIQPSKVRQIQKPRR